MPYIHACRCGGSCAKKNPFAGMGFLSAAATVPTSTPAATPPAPASAASIVAQICTAGVGKGNCTTSNVGTYTSFLQQAASSRFLPAYTTATGASSANVCAGATTATSGQVDLSVAKSATSIGLTATSGILTAIGASTAAIPIVGQIASLVTGVISMIVGHHATAVKEQDQLLCQVVPATNNVLSQIDAALAAGSLTPAQAESQYSSFLSQFASEVQSDPSYKAGDALNGYLVAMQVVIAARNQDLQDGLLTSGAPGPWTQTATATSGVSGAMDSLAASLGLSSTTASWLPWAVAGGIALLFLL